LTKKTAPELCKAPGFFASVARNVHLKDFYMLAMIKKKSRLF
jgi:hypothetical protein